MDSNDVNPSAEHDAPKESPKSTEELTHEMIEFLRGKTTVFPIFTAISPAAKPESQTPPQKKEIQFNLKPKEIKAYLDRFIIKQDEAKKVLSVAICDHFNHVKSCQNKGRCPHYTKQNIVMVGPSGVGKTFLIKCIADLIGVPFVKSDATKFTETGYVGGDVEDLIRHLVTMADGDINLAEQGIVYLDEIDKIAGSLDKFGKDVSGRGVQSNLLKLLEETEVSLRAPWDITSQIRGFMSPQSHNKKETISTRHILFIVSGAFVGLDELTKKRVEGTKFGFGHEKKEAVATMPSTADFVKYGFEPEFIGRIPVRVSCESLDQEALYQILKCSESSILNQIKESFNNFGIELIVQDQALKKISERALLEETGARGLGTVMERLFREFKFELPSTSITQVVITEETVLNPQAALKKLMESQSV